MLNLNETHTQLERIGPNSLSPKIHTLGLSWVCGGYIGSGLGQLFSFLFFINKKYFFKSVLVKWFINHYIAYNDIKKFKLIITIFNIDHAMPFLNVVGTRAQICVLGLRFYLLTWVRLRRSKRIDRPWNGGSHIEKGERVQSEKVILLR